MWIVDNKQNIVPSTKASPYSTGSISRRDSRCHQRNSHGNVGQQEIGQPEIHQPEVRQPEIRHIAFLKVHKAASSTMLNILYRFGTYQNLTFVLPKAANYILHSRPYTNILPPASNKTFDILCNHAIFSRDLFANIMPKDTVYVAIVREPFKRLYSAFVYYLKQFPKKYLWDITKRRDKHSKSNLGDSFAAYLKDPLMYEPISPIASQTHNRMAVDFGYPVEDFSNVTKFKDYLTLLDDYFDIVMVTELFDESIVLLRRLLHWKVKDILYISQNTMKTKVKNVVYNATKSKVKDGRYTFKTTMKTKVKDVLYTPQNTIKSKVKDGRYALKTTMKTKLISSKFKEVLENTKKTKVKDVLDSRQNIPKGTFKNVLRVPQNTPKPTSIPSPSNETLARVRKFLQLDYMLYDYFLHRLRRKIAQQGDNFKAEVTYFKRIQAKLKKFCLYKSNIEGNRPTRNVISFPSSQWNEEFNVTRMECKLMTMQELKFVDNIRLSHINLLNVNGKNKDWISSLEYKLVNNWKSPRKTKSLSR